MQIHHPHQFQSQPADPSLQPGKKRLGRIFLSLFLGILLLASAVFTAHMIAQVRQGSFMVTNLHPIEGYSDRQSYFAGEEVAFKIHSPSPTHTLEVIRFGLEASTLYTQDQIPGRHQDYPYLASELGANWEETYRFTLPDHCKSGLYAAKLTSGTDKPFYIPFVVKGQAEALHGPIGVLASTNTWNAYNSWGGVSLYDNDLNPEEEPKNGTGILSMDRPNPAANPTDPNSHLAGGERHILAWLEREGYDYKLFSDLDLHQKPELLSAFQVLIISTHNEYWTGEMYDHLEAFLNRGGNLLYLSGNGVYWKAVLQGQQMEVRKNFLSHRFDSTQGGYWRSHLHRPESAVLGVRFQNSDFSVPAPYQVLQPQHWIFAGTGLKQGDLIGQAGLMKPRGSNGGASGWETDQMDEKSPKNTVLLAKGANTIGKGAHMVYYDHPGGGGVFSVGSITFGGSLLVDSKLTRMVNNVLSHLLEKGPPSPRQKRSAE